MSAEQTRNDTTTSNFNKNDLLTELARSFPPRDHSKQLGRQWKKASDKASVLLQSKSTWHSSQIMEAFKILLQDASMDTQHIATVILFVQFLLNWYDQQQRQNNDNDDSLEKTLDAAQVNQMAVRLIQQLSARVVQSQQQQHDDDDTTACFALGSLLYGINPLVAKRPFFLAPLWKGICDILSFLKKEIPPYIANDTVVALKFYLQQGEAQTRSVSAVQQQQQKHHVKVLGFLVARVGNLVCVVLKHDVTEDIRTNISGILTVLLRLRGFAATTTVAPQSQDAPLMQLAHKIDNCLAKLVWLQEKDVSITIHDEALDLLIRTKESTKQQSHDLFALGKLLALHKLLWRLVESASTNKIAKSDSLVSWWLSICQEIMLSTLPACHDVFTNNLEETSDATDTLLADTIETVATALFVSETRYSTNGIKLYGIMIHWLVPLKEYLHPMTREAVVSLLHLYSCMQSKLAKEESSSSPRSVVQNNQNHSPLLALLVKLVLDQRTQSELCRNLVGVLMRIISSSSSNKAEVQQEKLLGNVAKQVVAKELRRLVSRGKTNERSNESLLHCFAKYPTANVVVIGRLLERVSSHVLPLLQDEIKYFCRNVVKRNEMNGSAAVTNLTISLLIGLLPSSDKEMLCRHVETTFQSHTGVSLVGFRNSLIHGIIRIWKSIPPNQCLSNRHAMIVSVAMRFVTASMTCLGQASPINQAPQLDQLLTLCIQRTVETKWITGPIIHDASVLQGEMMVVFDLVSLLGQIGSSISCTCRKETLQTIALTFKALFDTKIWPIVASTMTSFELFAKTLDATHGHVLKLCLPPEQQGLFQSRLQSVVHNANKSRMPSSCGNALMELIPNVNTRRPISTCPRDLKIALGSYVMEMPTLPGRSALVIFPPGKESKDDIKYMLDGDGNQTIHRVGHLMLTRNGQECRLMTKQVKKRANEE